MYHVYLMEGNELGCFFFVREVEGTDGDANMLSELQQLPLTIRTEKTKRIDTKTNICC